MVSIGGHVKYVDPRGVERDALVTNTFPGGTDYPSVNLVVVSNDESMTDNYGRQTGRVSSCVHESHQSAHGNFWREA